jgi:voltage-gated sodium channel
MEKLRAVVDSKLFANVVLAVIVLNAVLIGWQTSAPEAGWIPKLLSVCLWIFVVELLLKLVVAAQTGTLRTFVRDGWNIFDMVVIAGSFLPGGDPTLAAIARVIRVLRVFRLVRSIPELRLIVTVLVKSVISMKYISMLAGIILFIYGVIGVKLFGPHMPKEYGTLHESFFTLFRVLTGDNWSDLRYVSNGTAWQWKSTFYHVSWIIVSTFLLINLIVGAVLNNYQEVQEAERARARKLITTDERLAELIEEMRSILKARGSGG